ncbi:MAG: hypothetical protein EBX52_10490 [Proteobacteria bacterium]|nr:hypothetical protein [Pseudomonadota bacterium]
MKIRGVVSIFSVCVLWTAGALFAPETLASGNQVATVAGVSGSVQIFTHPSSKLPVGKQADGVTIARFEGMFYLIKAATQGDRVENGSIIRTLPGGQATVIYDNGDQFYVGKGTSYRIHWKEKVAKNGDPQPQLELNYGRIRGVISKEGPRRKIRVKTRSAVMGVRGTDFFIADDLPTGEVALTVVRGAVEVESKTGKMTEVKTDMSAEISDKIDVRKTTKVDLEDIKESVAPPPVKEKPVQVAELEKKALEVTMKDIQIYQPEAYQEIMKSGTAPASLEQVNIHVIEKARDVAPVGPATPRRPKLSTLRETDSTKFYDKYFKPTGP